MGALERTADESAGPEDWFPIVALGASAGGLAPTGELLRGLGPDPGIAVVVIHHLDPTHDSGLVDILSRATTMPVAAATDGVRVEANHVYVVPPNAGLLIVQGILRVVPRLDDGGLHLPIDRFFQSLSRDREGLAVGVVLSGSGFDGTEGMKAIKQEGGIALAQDDSAQFGSMPQSAIATGCIDFVLPPAGLARELTRIGAQAPAFRPRRAKVVDEEYPQILEAMRKASNVDYARYKPSTIQRRVQRRLFLRGLSELKDYVELLKHDPEEITTLCEEALIHVTSFFREPASFDALRTTVFPKLCADRPRESTLRVWVPGCSTGEEVYSIVICLLEFIGETHANVPLKIFGTDLSLAAITKARSARYPESIARDVSAVRLHRFFTRDEAGYQIRRDVRDLCVFAKHDVTRDPPFSGMDLISCRNLLIYLGPEFQDRVIALLHYALNAGGLLVLGSSETHRAFAGLVTLDGKNKIYQRTALPSRLTFDFASRSLASDLQGSTAEILGRAMETRPQGPFDVYREADRLVLAEFAPAGVVVTDDLNIVQFRGHTGRFLEPTPGAATLELLRIAREEVRLPLRRAIDRARATKSPASETGIDLGEGHSPITLEVIPFAVHTPQQQFFLVLFKEAPGAVEADAPAARVDERADGALRQELASTRQYLESVIEQLEVTNEELRAANEEVVSNNEELRSTNEELQSAKEELQATNEELRTVNDEMKDRHVETTKLGDDLANVLNSVQIPILIFDRDLALRRFTPAAKEMFGLLPSDVGRQLGDMRGIVSVAPALEQLVPDVLERLIPVTATFRDATGRAQQLSVHPYIAREGRIDGTVVAARDIEAETQRIDRLVTAKQSAEDIVNTVHEPLVVLDADLRVRSANRAFERAFELTASQVLGRRFDEVGRPELATAALRKVLAEVRAGATVEGFRLESEPGRSTRRSLLMNGRHIEGADLMLVALTDVTDAESEMSQRAELSFRDALTSAEEGVLMIDPDGRILFANPAATGMFGYSGDELRHLSVDLLLPGDRAAFLDANTSRRMGRGTDLVGRRKDGTEVPIQVSLSFMQRQGTPMVVAFVSDVSEQRKRELEIRTYQDRLQRMSFDAAVTEEQERRRIAVQLHDGIGQDLALARMELATVQNQLEGKPRAIVAAVMATLKGAIDSSSALVFDLSPPILYDLGLEKAVAWLADDVRTRHGMTIEVADDGTHKPLDEAAKAIVFRAIRELVMNVLKHAKVAAAKVSLQRVGNQYHIDVLDSGVGFDPSAQTAPTSFGLLSVHEQVARLGGTMKLESAPQQGTRISLAIPLASDQVTP